MVERKSNSILLIVFIVLTVLFGGYIVYDKFLAEEEKCNEEKEDEPKEEVVEPRTFDYNVCEDIDLALTIDMEGITSYNLSEKNEGYDLHYTSGYRVKLTNLKFGNDTYSLTYVLDKKVNPNSPDSGIVKIYLGNRLIAAHEAIYRNIFKSISISGNNITITEGARTDVQPTEETYDVTDLLK